MLSGPYRVGIGRMAGDGLEQCQLDRLVEIPTSRSVRPGAVSRSSRRSRGACLGGEDEGPIYESASSTSAAASSGTRISWWPVRL